jgi:hypothetical protein
MMQTERPFHLRFFLSRRLATALAGTILFRLPFWILQVYISWRQSSPFWAGDHHTICIWDCGIYSHLATHYTPEESAFFPLFPLLIRVLNRLLPFLGPNMGALLLSNGFTLLAGVLFLHFAEHLWKDENSPASRLAGFSTKSWLALLLLSVFPDGHFWMRGYSEPIFFTFLMAILLFLHHRQWLWAGLLCGLIAVLRPQGVWVAGISGVYMLLQLRQVVRMKRLELLGALFISSLPFAAFMFWLWKNTGNPIYFLHIQTSGWGRKFDLVQGLKDQLPRWDAGHLYLYVSLAAVVGFWRKRSGLQEKQASDRTLVSSIGFLLAELPVFFGGFYSYVRFASVNPLMFIFVAEEADGKPALIFLLTAWSIIKLAIQMIHSMNTWVG